jgi:hypothetical protein
MSRRSVAVDVSSSLILGVLALASAVVLSGLLRRVHRGVPAR